MIFKSMIKKILNFLVRLVIKAFISQNILGLQPVSSSNPVKRWQCDQSTAVAGQARLGSLGELTVTSAGTGRLAGTLLAML